MPSGYIDTIPLDIVYKEAPKYPVVVTRHPVERGAQIVDHAHSELYTLSVEALVSDFDGGDPAAALAALKSNYAAPKPIPVTLPRDIYDPVIMLSWEPVHENRHGGALRFKAEFLEWRVVNTQLAAVKRTAALVKKGAAKQDPKQQPGPQGTALKKLGASALINVASDYLTRQLGTGRPGTP